MPKKFNWKEFLGGLNLFRGDLWAKSIIFMIRHFIVFGVIFSVVAGVFYYRGRLNVPIEINLNYEKSFTLKLDGQTLYKPKNSSQLEIRDAKGNKIKTITAGDVKELRKKLSPFGLQLKPIFVAGIGTGEKGKEGEFGVGISWLRYFQWRIDNFLTQKGLYLGTSYKLKSMENSAIGIAIGKGYKNAENRILLYWKWRF